MEGGGDHPGHPGYADFGAEVARGEAGVYPSDVRSPAGDATAALRFPLRPSFASSEGASGR